jgi:excinuclease ABC subunit B
MDETARRRKKQTAYNKKNNITPRSIQKAIEEKISVGVEAAGIVKNLLSESKLPFSAHEPPVKIKDLEKQMLDAAENLQFEKAAGLRDAIARMKKEKDENTF